MILGEIKVHTPLKIRSTLFAMAHPEYLHHLPKKENRVLLVFYSFVKKVFEMIIITVNM